MAHFKSGYPKHTVEWSMDHEHWAMARMAEMEAEINTNAEWNQRHFDKIADLEIKLVRALGDIKWYTEQYADCADKLKAANAKLERYKQVLQSIAEEEETLGWVYAARMANAVLLEGEQDG